MHLAASAASQAAPGALGFLVVAGMGVALFLLFRSMTKHLRKVAVDPRQEPAAASSTPPGGKPVGSRPADGGPADGGPAGGGGPAAGGPGNGAAPGRVATGSSVTDGLANDSGTASGQSS